MTDISAEPKTDHCYDGIEEYDNPMPAWWVWIFVLTIFFSMGYWFILGVVGYDYTPQGFFDRDQMESLKAQYGTLGDVKSDEPTLVKFMSDEKWNRVGESIFKANCVTCHGADASGIAGPNLTDDYYIHVHKITDIADVVANGRRNGAMPAWKERLMPVEQTLVASYVASLRGKNLKSVGGRPAEGEQIAPWPAK